MYPLHKIYTYWLFIDVSGLGVHWMGIYYNTRPQSKGLDNYYRNNVVERRG
jgi:hypothetical protein